MMTLPDLGSLNHPAADVLERMARMKKWGSSYTDAANFYLHGKMRGSKSEIMDAVKTLLGTGWVTKHANRGKVREMLVSLNSKHRADIEAFIEEHKREDAPDTDLGTDGLTRADVEAIVQDALSDVAVKEDLNDYVPLTSLNDRMRDFTTRVMERLESHHPVPTGGMTAGKTAAGDVEELKRTVKKQAEELKAMRQALDGHKVVSREVRALLQDELPELKRRVSAMNPAELRKAITADVRASVQAELGAKLRESVNTIQEVFEERINAVRAELHGVTNDRDLPPELASVPDCVWCDEPGDFTAYAIAPAHKRNDWDVKNSWPCCREHRGIVVGVSVVDKARVLSLLDTVNGGPIDLRDVPFVVASDSKRMAEYAAKMMRTRGMKPHRVVNASDYPGDRALAALAWADEEAE